MKIIFEKICYKEKPLIWLYEIETKKATWTGQLAGASKSPLPRDVQRTIRNTEGIEEEGLKLIIKNVESFSKDSEGYKLLPDVTEIHSPRKSGQSFFKESDSPVPALATSPKKPSGSSSDSKITRVSGSPASPLVTSTIGTSSSSSGASIKQTPTKDLSLASLIPFNGELWRETLVYVDSLADKTLEDQKIKFDIIKSTKQLLKESTNEMVIKTSPIKKQIISSLRQLFDEILNPTLSKIRGEDATLPALIIYFRSVIREIMVEPPLTPLIREKQYSAALSPKFSKLYLRNMSIDLKLMPLYFFIQEDTKVNALTEDDELIQHLQWLKIHLHSYSQDITAIIEHLKTLLWELGEQQDAYSIKLKQLNEKITDHLPVNESINKDVNPQQDVKEFMSFYSLLEDLLSPISITVVYREKKGKKEEESAEEKLFDLLPDFLSNTMEKVILLINKEFSYLPAASGQIDMILRGASDFYISSVLYTSLYAEHISLNAGLKSVLPKLLLLDKKTREDLIKSASDSLINYISGWVINHITEHLSQVTGNSLAELQNQRNQRDMREQQSYTGLSMSC